MGDWPNEQLSNRHLRMDSNEAVTLLLEDLRRNDKLRRTHANFWNFWKKSSKELGIFSEIFERFQVEYGEAIMGWTLCPSDPPDICVTFSNRRIGVELTELVNENAVQAQIHKPENYSEAVLRFGLAEAKRRVSEIVTEKEKKVTRIVEEFDELALVIHTDEPLISSDAFEDYCLPERSSVFERIFLLFSYEPRKELSPILRIA